MGGARQRRCAMRGSLSRLALLVLLATAAPAGGAPPAVPDQVQFSATLPGGGTGVVDLTLRVYDASSGGILLYVQDFTNVPTTDGAFTLSLGPTGRATDPPGSSPLTTSVVTALSGDLAAGPNRFLEITVSGSPALPRTQGLAVPYALRAATAEVAETAGAVVQVGGVPPEVLG